MTGKVEFGELKAFVPLRVFVLQHKRLIPHPRSPVVIKKKTLIASQRIYKSCSHLSSRDERLNFRDNKLVFSCANENEVDVGIKQLQVALLASCCLSIKVITLATDNLLLIGTPPPKL